MKVASVFCPSFSTISIPLGIVYVNTRLRAVGHEVDTYDFELLLDLVDPDFNPALHHFIIYPSVEEEENGRVLFVNRLDALLETLYGTPPVDDHPIVGQALAYAERFAEHLASKGHSVVLFSTYNSNLFFSLLLAQALKRRSPSIKTIFGGPAVSFPAVYELLLGTRLCDYCVVGEGEGAIVDLVAALERGVEPRVPGVAYHNRLHVSFAPRSKLDLRELELPEYDGFPFAGARPQIYSVKTGYFALPISASRGCTLRCAFCAETNFWESFRAREVRAVVDEMERLADRYGSRVFHVCDSLINAKPEWLEAFCDVLLARRERFHINFAYCQARNLTQAAIEKMATAGFRSINFGVESGSDALLKKMHKGTKSATIRDIILWSLRAGIMVDFPILRNLPGETREDVWENISFVAELEEAIAREDPPGGLVYSADTTFRLEAMSGIFRHPEHYGLRLEPFEMTLPDAARHLEPLVRPMLVRWTNDVDASERRARSLAMAGLRRPQPKQKYTVEDCLEWVDLRYGYALQRDVRFVPDAGGADLFTRFGQFRIGPDEAELVQRLGGGDAGAIAERLGWPAEDTKLVLANLLAAGALRTDGSAYLLGDVAWPELAARCGSLAPHAATEAP